MALTPPTLTLPSTKGGALSIPELEKNLTDIVDYLSTLTAQFGIALKEDGTLNDATVDVTQLVNRAVTTEKLSLQNAFYATDTGEANKYAVTFDPAPVDENLRYGGLYKDGILLYVKAAHSNTDVSTLDLGGLGEADILKKGALSLDGGEITAGSTFVVISSGGKWHLLGGGSGNLSGTAAEIPSNFTGLTKYESSVAIPDPNPWTTPADAEAVFAHGLDAVPEWVRCWLACTAPDNGYEVGDVIPIDNVTDVDGKPAFIVRPDSSSVKVRRMVETIKVAHRETGAASDLTVANWELTVKAQATFNEAQTTFPALTWQCSVPDGVASYGNAVYFFQKNRYDLDGHLFKLDMATGQVTYVGMWSTGELAYCQPSTIKGGAGDYIYWTGANGATRLTPSTDALDDIPSSFGGWHNYKICAIDETSDVTNPNFYGICCGSADVNNQLSNLRMIKWTYSGGNYTTAQVGTNLNLRDNAFSSSDDFRQITGLNDGGVPNVWLFQWNPVKRRIYLIDHGSGLLHILKISGTDDIQTWWANTSGRYGALTYVKSLMLAGTSGYHDTGRSRGKCHVEFDTSTGEEKAVTWSSNNNEAWFGTIVRVPWKE